jgi:natural product biosynthesis luciferase-like monooxygenase protein
MTHFSCVVVGNESLLIGCGDALLDRGHDILAVVSQDPGILAWARAKGLTAHTDIMALRRGDHPASFDWLLSIANLSLIPDAVLALPARGAINFHDGPLPRYAGLNAPVWAIANGETRYGVTWHMLEGGVDEGDIVAQSLFDISADETAFSLNSKCYGAAMDGFAGVIEQLESGAPQRRAQDLTQRSYFARAKRPAAAGRLDFNRAGKELAALVRSLDFAAYQNPLTCPKIDIAGRVVLVGSARLVASMSDAAPGTVLECDRHGLVVATGAGVLRLDGLRDSGGQPLSLGGLPEAGHILTSPDASETEALDAALQRSLKGEAHWRAALDQMQPVPVPLAGSATTTPDWGSRGIALPQSLNNAACVAAAMVWALRGSDGERVDVALSDAGIARAARDLPGYVQSWVPLHINGGETLAEATARLQQDVQHAEKLGGFACDLIARDPAIIQSETPAIGIALNTDTPIEGTCLTLGLSGDRQASLHFDRSRLSEDAVALLVARLECAADVIAHQDMREHRIDRLPDLPAAERRQILVDWNQSARDFNREQTLHRAFEDQVARTPDAIAVVFEDDHQSYAALNARANALAARLQACGVRPGIHVGLYVRRSPDLLVGALAVLKAGGAYVPLDPAYPAERIAHYASDSDAMVIVTQGDLQASLPACEAQVLLIEDTAADPATTNIDAANIDGGATGDDLAYLIYTSGSTGTPKGVMVQHRNVANFFAGMDARIDHDSRSVWLAVTSLSFDISVLELFWTLARGFKVVLGSDESRAAVSGGPITVSDRAIDFNLFYWGNDDGPGPRKYQLLLDGARFADANGFNAVWTPERHFHAFGGPYPNPSVTGAAVAAVTKNLSVRAGSCVAPLHHPARIAEDWSVIDNLTNGRAGLGIAAGWQPHDFVLRPENAPPDNKPAMYEAIETLRRLWRGDAVEFPMRDGSMHAVVTQPRPVSKELPIWVTIAGNPDTWREAGEIGANVLTHLLGQSIDEVAGKIKIYHAALREAGHNPEDFTVTLMLHTYLAQTRDAAERVARGPMKEYMGSAAGLIKQFAWVFPAFKRPKGVNNAFEMDLGTLGDDELEAILDFAFERYFEDSGLFGTIQDALARVEQLKCIGVNEIGCLIDFGIEPELVMEGLKPLAEALKLAKSPSILAEDDFSIAAQIIRHKVTHMQCTPSMARLIAMDDAARLAMGRVQHLLLGGEALPAELVADLRRCTNARIQNMYGPTETTVWSSCETVSGDISGTVGIGAPIANTSLYVLDKAGDVAPIGVAGELYIGGEGVTQGYWQRPDLTAEMFVADPFAQETGLTSGPAGQRMYRTGDLVRRRADGGCDFLGRADHQVKMRGQRIELGEIESCIGAFAGITGAVVAARERAAGDVRLLAWYTATTEIAEPALRAHLARHLTEVMIPAHLVRLDAFPLTPNGKIDRRALPEPAAKRAPIEVSPAATDAIGEIEADIAAIWSRILGVGDIRPDDNFFMLGGHSLLAVQAHREIRKALDLPKLSITDIFRFPVLAALAAHLGRDLSPEPTPTPETGGSERLQTMSKRRAMRAGRGLRAG